MAPTVTACDLLAGWETIGYCICRDQCS